MSSFIVILQVPPACKVFSFLWKWILCFPALSSFLPHHKPSWRWSWRHTRPTYGIWSSLCRHEWKVIFGNVQAAVCASPKPNLHKEGMCQKVTPVLKLCFWSQSARLLQTARGVVQFLRAYREGIIKVMHIKLLKVSAAELHQCSIAHLSLSQECMPKSLSFQCWATLLNSWWQSLSATSSSHGLPLATIQASSSSCFITLIHVALSVILLMHEEDCHLTCYFPLEHLVLICMHQLWHSRLVDHLLLKATQYMSSRFMVVTCVLCKWSQRNVKET